MKKLIMICCPMYELNGNMIEFDCNRCPYSYCKSKETHDNNMTVYLAKDGVRDKYIRICNGHFNNYKEYGWSSISICNNGFCITCSNKVSQVETLQYNNKCVECYLNSLMIN